MVDVISTKRGVFVFLFAILYMVANSLQLYLSYSALNMFILVYVTDNKVIKGHII